VSAEAEALEPDAGPAAEEARAGRLSLPRRISIYALVVVASLLILVSVFATWVKTVILDTDVWVDTSSQFLANDTIRPELANFIVNQVFGSVDVQQTLESTLPSQLRPLAAPAAAGLRQLADRTANQVLESPRVQQLWADANRAAQQAFVRVVEGNSEVVTQNGSVVTIDMKPIITQVVQQIGLSGNLIAKLPPSAGQITILSQGRLAAVTKAINVLKIVAFWFGIAGLALWALAVYLAKGRRRKTIRTIAISLLVIGVLLVLFRNQLGTALVNALVAADAVRPAAREAWSIATQVLHDSTITVIVVALVGLFASWVAGPSRWATGLRRWLTPWLRRPALVYGVYAFVLLLLLVWGPTRSLRNVITIVILFGLATIGLEVLRRQAIREFPDADHQPGAALWAGVTGAGSAVVARVRHTGDGPPDAGGGDDGGSGAQG